MTLKTGNFKKFSLFIKMLSTALNKQSDTVFIDLLTYADLEALKQRKLQGNTQLNATTNNNNNKRYLILTYVAEFDK